MTLAKFAAGRRAVRVVTWLFFLGGLGLAGTPELPAAAAGADPATVLATAPAALPSTVASTVTSTVASTAPATAPGTVPETVPDTVPATVPAQPDSTAYALTAWPTKDGVPGDIFALTQDLEGYLWVGTASGLLRFDGSRFTPWTPDPGGVALPGGPVHALVGSHQGFLWVGFGGGGGIARIRGGRLERYTPADGAPPGVNAMIEDREGVIWAASNRGLFRFVSDRWTRITEAEGYTGREAFGLLEDRGGRLWVGTAAGILRRTLHSFELVDPAVTEAQSLVEDEAGEIWATDRSAVMTRLSTHAPPQRSPAVRLPAGGWRLLHDRRGALWVAAFGGGLLRVAEPTTTAALLDRVEYEDRLSGSPRALYQDRDGNIWVGMRGGLLRVADTSFRTARLEGLTNDGVRTATVAADGSVWIATGHALNRFADGARTTYPISQTLALHNDRRGDMWVATSQHFGRLRDGRIVDVPIPGGPAIRVMAMADTAEWLWLCTALKGVQAWDGTAFVRFDQPRDSLDRGCQSILADRQDRVWAGFMAGGAALFERGAFRTFGERDGLTPGTVLAIVEANDGAVWFATSGGVSRYQNGRFTGVTQANAPLDGVVPVLIEDDDGYIWVGVNAGAGVMRFHPGEVDKLAVDPGHHLEYALYDETDGMEAGSQLWQSGVGGVRGRDGRLWVATGAGMTTIDPRNLPARRGPSTPRMHSAMADGRRIDPSRELELANGATLHVEFAALSLSTASKLRFRHMLEGLDRAWVYDSRAPEATYTSLPAGNYQLRVSTTHDGQWAEANIWAFAVARPFYLRPWFLAAIVAVLGAVVSLAWWLRVRAIKDRYALVFAERARMSREIHDTLLQSLAALGTELEALAQRVPGAQLEVSSELRRIGRQVRHSLREARDSIMELRRNSMSTRPLEEALRELANEVGRRHGVDALVTVVGARPARAAADMDLQLFRIGQEAVSNAIRHGRATCIRIVVGYEGDRVVLNVRDNGCGFTPAPRDAATLTGEHFGLVTMRERAERLRGSLRIESGPGQGTIVETVIPAAAA